MYSGINIISILIRQFLLPNPYMHIIKNTTYADIFNIVAGGTILHISSFILAGLVYKKRIDSPSYGSFLYLLFYIFMTLLITYVTYFISNIKVVIIIIVFIYSVLLLVLNHLSTKTYDI